MKKNPTLLLIFLAIIFCRNIYSQKGYEVGDIVNETIPVYDVDGKLLTLKVTNGYNLLVYRYRWMNAGRGIDNQDSINELQNKIDRILLSGEISNLKVVCLSYDQGLNYPKWCENIKKEKPFKPHPNYVVEYYNLNSAVTEQKCQKMFTKVNMFAADGRVIRHASSIAKFDYNLKSNDVTVQGKLLTDKNGVKEPLTNAFVHLESTNGSDTVAKGKSDMYGDFKLTLPNNNKDYSIKVRPNNNTTTNVLILTRGGREISKMQKTSIANEFGYKLLKADIITLSEIQEEDITLKYEIFNYSKSKELTTIENIYYELLKSNIEERSIKILNKVVTILKDNPNVKLEIISHTDAQGDDAFNKTLSEKRAAAVAEYLIKNGISSSRLKTIGKGETQIRNRCGNGINCSDKEHEYNRRTEFKYTRE